jgi:Rrf2 family transcriptional regulator, cysteine metabolism repressor
MFNINKATEYAILFLSFLAKNQSRPMSINTISKNKKLPFKYLEKIAAKLKAKNIINSKKGVNGGYILAKDTKDISISSIIQAIEGRKGIVSCIGGQCQFKNSCLHQKVWLNLQTILDQELKSIKLAHLLE